MKAITRGTKVTTSERGVTRRVRRRVKKGVRRKPTWDGKGHIGGKDVLRLPSTAQEGWPACRDSAKGAWGAGGLIGSPC